MNSHPDVQKSTVELNITSLHNIFGQNALVSSPEQGKYNVATVLVDGMVEGGQQMQCSLHREMVAIKNNHITTTVIAWVLDDLSLNGSKLIDEPKIKILISDDPYQSEEFQATLANLELQSLFQSNTDEHQIYAQSQIETMDSVVNLVHEVSHFRTIQEFTKEQEELMKKYAVFKSQIDHMIYQYVVDKGFVPEIEECENLRTKFAKELMEKETESGITDLRQGAVLMYQNEISTNRETIARLNQSADNMSPRESDDYRLRRYLTLANMSYARTINGIFGPGTVNPGDAEVI